MQLEICSSFPRDLLDNDGIISLPIFIISLNQNLIYHGK